MNRPRLIWGLMCCTLGALIAVLSAVLPLGTITFMVEGNNQPWVAAVGLALLGVVLLVDAARRGSGAR